MSILTVGEVKLRSHRPLSRSVAVVVLDAFTNKLHTITQFFQYLYTVLHGYQICDCARAFILGIPDSLV